MSASVLSLRKNPVIFNGETTSKDLCTPLLQGGLCIGEVQMTLATVSGFHLSYYPALEDLGSV